jgi:hypothetical protein
MATSNAAAHQTFVASETIGKYKAVVLGTADNNIDLAGAGERVIGVTGEISASANEAVDVQIYGVAKVEAGGTISKGSYVKADADGNAVATTTDRDDAFGIALEAAVDGDIFSVLLCPGIERSTA